MPLRDLFCIVEVAEKPSKVAIEQTVALARSFGAHASLVVAGPKIAAPYTMFSTTLVGSLVKSENEKIRGLADGIAGEVEDALKHAGVTGEVELCLEFFQDLLLKVKGHALCTDLTVLDRPGGVIERSEVLFEEMLFGTGKPVLIAVPDRRPVETIEKIVLAWDGSVHAARATSAALALFADLKQVDVLVVTGEKDLSNSVPGAKAAAHIERHGVKAKVAEVPVDKTGVATTIDSYAAKNGADLIVMGGFGRSRLREFVLGGVTRQLSQSASTLLMLVH